MKSLSTDHLSIDYLSSFPQYVAPLAQWHQQQWHDISPHLDIDKRIALLSTHHNETAVPLTLIALQNNQLLGSASLVENDMKDRPQYSPWLASVYVDPAYRKQGIASALISDIIAQARLLGLPKIYLFTPDQAEFYARRGWDIIEHRHYHSTTVDIMSYQLTEDAR